jgi:hypothetical protein
MKDNSQTVSVLEDASTFTEFMNLSGDISKYLYLATHPEENDEAPPIMIRKVSASLEQKAA